MDNKHIQRILLSPADTVLSYHPNSTTLVVELDSTSAGFDVQMPDVGSNENRVFRFINLPTSGEGNSVVLKARSIFYTFTEWTIRPYEGVDVIDNLRNTYLIFNAI